MPQLDDAAGVSTQYVDQGEGDPVVLLHGGLGDGRSWSFAVDALAAAHRVLVPDRQGHGRTPDVDGPLTYEGMAAETIAFLDQVVGGPAHLVGYSDGGIVALHVAIDRPDLVASMVTIGTNFHVDGLLPAIREGMAAMDPDDDGLASMRAEYAEISPGGGDHWATFVTKSMAMGTTGPTLTVGQLATITAPTLVVAGDDDLVDHHHTVELFEALPDARLAIVPGTSHALPDERPDAVLALVDEFLHGDPPQRMIPIRTAPSG